LHDWLGLHMQVPNHGIAMPSPKDYDKVEVDLATKQRHGADGAKTPGSVFLGLDTGSLDVCGRGGPQGVGSVEGFHRDVPATAVVGSHGRR
jgi:hypothetical protein